MDSRLHLELESLNKTISIKNVLFLLETLYFFHPWICYVLDMTGVKKIKDHYLAQSS